MITLFVALGLGLVCGGAYAIVDGWPYLVLERGFTQVIIGTVSVTAGVILLALARVLVELRRVRTVVANAMMAVSLGAVTAAAAAEPSSARAMPEPPPETQPMLPGLAAAGLGAAAVLAATQASAPVGDEPARPDEAEQTKPDEADTADLFRETPSVAAPSLPVTTDFDALLRDLIPARPIDAEQARDEPVWPAPPAAWTNPDLDVPHVLATEPAPAAAGEPAHREDSLQIAEDDAELPAPTPRDEEPAWPGLRMPDESKPAPQTREGEEFAFLRERLSELSPVPAEPASASRAEPDIGMASAWMQPDAARREPWFDNSREAEDRDETGKPETSFWQRSEKDEPAFDEPVEAALPAINGRDRDFAAGELAPTTEPSLKQEAAEPEPGPDMADALPAPSPPATSEEGIVGAYQVGDANFTIYANGSIQARTPDGDYAFGSMDELKEYLASEKNRLGV